MFRTSVLVISTIIAVNSQETLSSLNWLPRNVGFADSNSDVISMTVWLDTIIYQCNYSPPIVGSAMESCVLGGSNCCAATGSYCDPALDGQLLISNDDDNEIVIDEITLITNDGTNDIMYTITNWCIDQADASLGLTGYMVSGGATCGNADPALNCIFQEGLPTTQCEILYPDVANMTSYESICVGSGTGSTTCSPPEVLTSFNLDEPGCASRDGLFMNGAGVSTATETCSPTTSQPTTAQPTTAQPTAQTEIPTISPTQDDIDSDDSDGSDEM